MKELEDIFEKTFADKNFSKAEKQAVTQLIRERGLSIQERDYLRSRIFDLVRNNLNSSQDCLALDWLETANKTLLEKDVLESKSRVYFTPGDDALNAILAELGSACNVIKICVFTISDDRLSKKLMECSRRGVHVKVITDNEKVFDTGSDVRMLYDTGIPVKIDNSPNHMHNKFAIVDNKTAITGSYNWTRSAGSYNQENILISCEPSVVSAYIKEFDRLWEKMDELH